MGVVLEGGGDAWREFIELELFGIAFINQRMDLHGGWRLGATDSGVLLIMKRKLTANNLT